MSAALLAVALATGLAFSAGAAEQSASLPNHNFRRARLPLRRLRIHSCRITTPTRTMRGLVRREGRTACPNAGVWCRPATLFTRGSSWAAQPLHARSRSLTRAPAGTTAGSGCTLRRVRPYGAAVARVPGAPRSAREGARSERQGAVSRMRRAQLGRHLDQVGEAGRLIASVGGLGLRFNAARNRYISPANRSCSMGSRVWSSSTSRVRIIAAMVLRNGRG